jgi:uncharacterized OB-fold protein
MSPPARSHPDPVVNLETERYWAAARDGVLLLKRCTDCGRTHWYPRAVCPHCLSGATEWYQASGHGTVYTFSVMREEGVTMMTQIVDCDVERLAIGDAVSVTFEATESGHALPVFRPRPPAEGATR